MPSTSLRQRFMNAVRNSGKLLRDERGAVAINAGILAIVVFGAAGLAVDGSRAYLGRYKLQNAIDAAALAIGTDYSNEEELAERAERYVRANFKFGGATVECVQLILPGSQASSSCTQGGSLGSDRLNQDELTVVARVSVKNYFMGVMGMGRSSLAATTDVKRAGGGLMVALVLDYTGSMWSNNNIGHLRTATTSLVNNLFGSDSVADDLRVSMVPYSSSVNPGLANIVETRVGDAPLDTTRGWSDRAKDKWAGCVLERNGSNSLDDTPPSEELWRRYWYPSALPTDDTFSSSGAVTNSNDNAYDITNLASIIPGGSSNTNQITGPNIGCPTPIVPLTKFKSDLTDAIAVTTAWNRGGTLTDIGIAWGLRTLSPGEPFTQSYDELDVKSGLRISESPRWRKAMVIMTDGDSTFFNFSYNCGSRNAANPNCSHKSASDYTGYGRLYSTNANANMAKPANYDLAYASKPANYDWNADAEYRNWLLFRHAPELAGKGGSHQIRKLSYRIKQMCDRAKSQGIIVYTVVFTSLVGPEIRDLYRECASDPGKYWYTDNGASLNIAFGTIGTDLNKLRIIR